MASYVYLTTHLVDHGRSRYLVQPIKEYSVTVLHLITQTWHTTCCTLPLRLVFPVRDWISLSLPLHTHRHSLHSWACMTWSWYFKLCATPTYPRSLSWPRNCAVGLFAHQTGSTVLPRSPSVFRQIFLECGFLPKRHHNSVFVLLCEAFTSAWGRSSKHPKLAS